MLVIQCFLISSDTMKQYNNLFNVNLFNKCDEQNYILCITWFLFLRRSNVPPMVKSYWFKLCTTLLHIKHQICSRWL